MKVRAIFANVGRHRPKKQKKAFRKVKRKLARAWISVIGWAEIGEADGKVNEPRLLKRIWFPKKWGWRNKAVWTHTPITFHKIRWNLIEVEKIRTMRGIKGVTPARYIVVAKLHVRGRKGKKLAFINNHFVAGAWNGEWNKHERAREDGWAEHWEALEEVITDLHEQGYNVVIVGDFNRQGKFAPPHPDVELVTHYKTDRIYALPAKGWILQIKKTGKRKLGIDFHRAIWAVVKFKKG